MPKSCVAPRTIPCSRFAACSIPPADGFEHYRIHKSDLVTVG
jgi:hypothetical protein